MAYLYPLISRWLQPFVAKKMIYDRIKMVSGDGFLNGFLGMFLCDVGFLGNV
jgi:hypothetical protein